jgi:hypothetical protein
MRSPFKKGTAGGMFGTTNGDRTQMAMIFMIYTDDIQEVAKNPRIS